MSLHRFTRYSGSTGGVPVTGPQLEPAAAAPDFRGRRLLYVVTGGVQAMFLPSWLTWLRAGYPDLQVRHILTRAATRFVTPTIAAVAAGGTPGLLDEWPDQPSSALHVELAQWPDTILVHPATMHFMGRLALGLADTPALLALQCTMAPIVVCPSLPPHGHLNPAYRRHVLELSARDNITVLPPTYGTSISTGETGIGTPAQLTDALHALEQLRQWGDNTP
ncbi:flavoprotein [Nocardia sp. NPDC051570]|uniref:flavoprotein n=1 Tax=Nocardia sp. NPDC051570 TaxID=3364324 RepID=UPI0037B91B57